MIRLDSDYARSVEESVFHVCIFRHEDHDMVVLTLVCRDKDVANLNMWVATHLYFEEYSAAKTTFRIFSATGVELK